MSTATHHDSNTTSEQAMSNQLETTISRPSLQAHLEVCRETMRQWMKTGRLPPPDINISRKKQGWKISTLRAAGINV